MNCFKVNIIKFFAGIKSTLNGSESLTLIRLCCCSNWNSLFKLNLIHVVPSFFFLLLVLFLQKIIMQINIHFAMLWTFALVFYLKTSSSVEIISLSYNNSVFSPLNVSFEILKHFFFFFFFVFAFRLFKTPFIIILLLNLLLNQMTNLFLENFEMFWLGEIFSFYMYFFLNSFLITTHFIS